MARNSFKLRRDRQKPTLEPYRPSSPLLSEHRQQPVQLQLLPSLCTPKTQNDSPHVSPTETKLMNMMEKVNQRLESLENHLMKLTASEESGSPFSLASVHSAINELPSRLTVQLSQGLPRTDEAWQGRVEEQLCNLKRTCDNIYEGVHCTDKPVASFLVDLPQQLRNLQETCANMSDALGPMETDGVTTSTGQILDILVKKLLPAINQLQNDGNLGRQALAGQLQQLTSKSAEIDGLEARLQNTKDQLKLAQRSAASHRNFKSMAERFQGDLNVKEQQLRSLNSLQEESTQLNRKLEADVSSLQAQLDKRNEEISSLKKKNECMQNELQEKMRQRSRTQEGARPNSPHMQRRASATEEMRIQQGEGHDELICDVEDLLTDTEGPLGLLETHLEFYDAHVLLSSTLQLAYDKSRDVAIDYAQKKLLTLFSKQERRHTSDMDYTSRAYGMLLHAVGARSKEVNPDLIRYIADEVRRELARTNGLFNSLCSKLQQTEQTQVNDALTKVVSLAWRLVAQPNPVIVCQPQVKFDREIMDKELNHWDKTLREYELVYAHPVVYRSYSGMVESKGAVGNRTKSTPVDEVKRKDEL